MAICKVLSKTKTTQKPSYEDFEPFLKWHHEVDRETIDIDLHDFKKEQLKVLVSNSGILKVMGERPLDLTKHSRFVKEIRVPKECDADEVYAKFGKGNLQIVMPKKIQTVSIRRPRSRHVYKACDLVSKWPWPKISNVAVAVALAFVLVLGAYIMCTQKKIIKDR